MGQKLFPLCASGTVSVSSSRPTVQANVAFGNEKMYPGKVRLPHVPTPRWEWGVGWWVIRIFIGSEIAVFSTKTETKRYGHIICLQKLIEYHWYWGKVGLSVVWGFTSDISLPSSQRRRQMAATSAAVVFRSLYKVWRKWSRIHVWSKKMQGETYHDFSHPFSMHSFMARHWKINRNLLLVVQVLCWWTMCCYSLGLGDAFMTYQYGRM